MTAYTLHALKDTEKKFMGLLRKIEALEKEKAGLMAEIESLKERCEAKARELENEVTVLRKEVKTLEKLLNLNRIPK